MVKKFKGKKEKIKLTIHHPLKRGPLEPRLDGIRPIIEMCHKKGVKPIFLDNDLGELERIEKFLEKK